MPFVFECRLHDLYFVLRRVKIALDIQVLAFHIFDKKNVFF